jgi:HD-GYP domain-containing protein (c-di-GMP phosphodiesterase class II)
VKSLEGLFTHHAAEDAQGSTDGLSLLAKHGDIEIMRQLVTAGATVWLSPGSGENTFEFFFVQRGRLEIAPDGDDVQSFGAGDSFYVHGLNQNVMLRCIEEAELLYVSNSPVYDNEMYWQQELQSLLRRIDEKDHYTKRHSRAVMEYALQLYKELKDHCPGLALEDFVMGALFHDVGKCNVPGDILRKKARLTNDEYHLIQHHPIDSARLLEPIYGPRIAELAYSHHERMDGKGYPRGLKGDEIPFEARILAVADTFDAMTSDRGYNRVKSFEEAAQELLDMPEAYDPTVTKTLARLVSEGRIGLQKEE